jgi:N-acetyl sugar amidotransferase
MISICNNCVMDASDPKLDLDNNEVCWQCRNFSTNVAPLLNKWTVDQTAEFFDRVKKESSNVDYHCLIGLSGGLDSSYLAYQAVKIHGLRAKLYHVDAGWNTPQATRNIHKLVSCLGCDFETKVIDWESLRQLQIAFFKSGVAHIDVPQDHAFLASVYAKANEDGIGTILNGGNFATEGIRNPLSWLYFGSDTRQLNDIASKFGADITDYPVASALKHRIVYQYIKRIRNLKPLNYMKFTKSEAERELSAAYGYEPYAQKHFESYFTKYFEGYWLPKRFGYDTRKPQFSSLIWSGDMTRTEALDRLRTPALSNLEASLLKSYVADKLHLPVSDLESFEGLERRTYKDFKNMGDIYSFGAKVLSLVGLEKTVKR